MVPDDVQSRGCGGIQYTQHNMPNKANKSKASGHIYKGCRDAVTVPQPGATPPSAAALISSGTDGTYSFGTCLHPMGLTSTTLGASTYAAGGTGNVQGPPLRGLYNKAVDFQWYRITRAKFVFVPVITTTNKGQITLSAYTDPFDIANTTTTGQVSGQYTKSFPIAATATRECSVPIPVDSTWKKCTSILTVPGNVFPFTAASAGAIAIVNTVADLTFGAVFARVVGADVSIPIGTFYIDYDVEFKAPIDSSVNL